jgi:hypothetical protein
VSEGEKTRLVAWSRELRRVHDRLREALTVTRRALAAGEPATSDLLVFCHGFCDALTAHHEGEDRDLFPAIAEQHPELRETLYHLQQDHSMIAHLLAGLQAAVARADSPAEIAKQTRRGGNHGVAFRVRGTPAPDSAADPGTGRRPLRRAGAPVTAQHLVARSA